MTSSAVRYADQGQSPAIAANVAKLPELLRKPDLCAQ
jgi:hypothetical protein